MESSAWSDLNNDIKIVDTVKSFYRKFVYRASFRITGASYIVTSYRFKSIEKDTRDDKYIIYDIRQQIASIVNDPLNYLSPSDFSDPETLLWSYRAVHTLSNNSDFRVRIEGSTLNIYCADEDKLFEFIINNKLSSSLAEISRPKSDLIKKMILNKKVIIVPTKNKYKFKIYLREGNYSLLSRVAVLNYLVSLDDLVSLTKSTRNYLQRRQDYLGGCYFYSNDKHIANFIELISPNLVADIFELEHSPAK